MIAVQEKESLLCSSHSVNFVLICARQVVGDEFSNRIVSSEPANNISDTLSTIVSIRTILHWKQGLEHHFQAKR